MLMLSDLLGSDVRSVDGEILGHLVDLTVEVGDIHPAVGRVAIGRRRRIRALVEWGAVVSFEHEDIQLSMSLAEVNALAYEGRLSGRELFLARDVLDTQIVDVVGKRLARVSEVLLARSGTTLHVAAVEVGAAGVWRRLGMDRFAERTPERTVDWADLHLTSARGHALQLATPDAAVHRLAAAELASVVAHLPTVKAAEVLDAVSPVAAASALSASHPKVGARLLHAVSGETATSVVAHMPVDDAAAVLRGLPSEAVEGLLENVVSERAAMLRRLLAHPADTAGGLMNTEVRSAGVRDSVETIRDRVAADVPELEGLATVFVVDDDGRPVGSFEPNDLLAGRATPRPVPAVPVTLPVERVIDLFALHDYLALPVVDADGRLVGVVAIDDVLEELLAERLPGQGRYARIRRRGRSSRLRRHSGQQPTAER
jgi:CBS domain-containing protein